MVRKPLLALLCAIGLTIAPQTQCMEPVVTGLVVYEIISLFRTWTRDPKPDKTQRPFIDYSMKLYKSNRKQWMKNVRQNVWIFQEDYVEGQGFKDTYLKLKQGEKIKASKRKCSHFGMNGWLMFYLAFIGKTRKSIQDLSFLVFAMASLKGGIPRGLAGHSHFDKFFKYWGWDNPYDKTNAQNALLERIATALERRGDGDAAGE